MSIQDEDGFLRITNFAFDCRFMEAVRSAASPEELKGRLGNDRFYWLCVLFDECLSKLERPTEHRSEMHYRSEYWGNIFGMLPDLMIALRIARDVLKDSGCRYDPKTRIFVSPDGGTLPAEFRPGYMLHDEMFDFPNSRPQRYAYRLVRRGVEGFTTVEREATGGEFAYSINFKVVPEPPKRPATAGSHGAQTVESKADELYELFAWWIYCQPDKRGERVSRDSEECISIRRAEPDWMHVVVNAPDLFSVIAPLQNLEEMNEGKMLETVKAFLNFPSYPSS